jgi:hypothetical protein
MTISEKIQRFRDQLEAVTYRQPSDGVLREWARVALSRVTDWPLWCEVWDSVTADNPRPTPAAMANAYRVRSYVARSEPTPAARQQSQQEAEEIDRVIAGIRARLTGGDGE